jgi:hypothetical protein
MMSMNIKIPRVEGCYGQIGAGYLFDTGFQTDYLERVVDCYDDFM